MVKDELVDLIYQAVRKAQKKGDLPKTDIPGVSITRPRQAQRGDYTSNQPLQMIAAVNTTLKAAGHRPLTPVELGQRIAHRLPQAPFIKQVEVSPPGSSTSPWTMSGWPSRWRRSWPPVTSLAT